MLGTYFYHEILRKTVISFGTLFNQIYIKPWLNLWLMQRVEELPCVAALISRHYAPRRRAGVMVTRMVPSQR